MDLEVCIDDFASLLRAKEAGADRVEICSSLNIGGLTPSPGLLKRASEVEGLELFVMVRPRSGDFCYSEDEFQTILEDIALVKTYKNIDGIVAGFLHPDGTIDFERTRLALEAARPLDFVYSRAFDESKNAEEEIGGLIDLGVKRILTSGKEKSALEGLDLIAEITEKYGDRIEIMPGGGVRAENIPQIYQRAKVPAFHMSARVEEKSAMENLSLAAITDFESKIHQVDYDKVRAARQVIDSL